MDYKLSFHPTDTLRFGVQFWSRIFDDKGSWHKIAAFESQNDAYGYLSLVRRFGLLSTVARRL